MEKNGKSQERKSGSGYKTALIIVLTFLSAYGLANLEVIRRARNAYMQGQIYFNEREYKQAMWCYQEVEEFYFLPHSHWVDDATKQEWICRAELGDFIPPEGPLDADVRKLRPDYAKYKDLIATITPIGDITYTPAPPSPEDIKIDKELKNQKH